MIEDTLLVWKLRNGREDGLVRTYSKYKNYLLKIAYALLDDGQQVEDVVQDVFVALAESSHRLRLDGNLRGYLVRCLINRVQNMKKARSACQAVPLSEVKELCSDGDRPDQWVILDDEQRRAHSALCLLPESQRVVIALHLHGGLRFKQIASLQKTSINTVQSRYRYGLEKLRFLLNGEVNI
jgi:RNA polymerase sigma-70 factor (ECF subfamily)